MEIRPEADQHGRGSSLALPHQPKEYVFGPDVAVIQLQRLGSASSKTFLARGVKGGDPDGTVPAVPIISCDLVADRLEDTPRDRSV